MEKNDKNYPSWIMNNISKSLENSLKNNIWESSEKFKPYTLTIEIKPENSIKQKVLRSWYKKNRWKFICHHNSVD